MINSHCDRPDVLSEKRAEVFERARNEIKQHVQTAAHHATLPNIAQSYLEGKIHLHIRCAVKGDSQQFVATLHRTEGREGNPLPEQAFRPEVLQVNHADGVDTGVGSCCCYQKAVLINDVEIVKGNKRILADIVLSTIWLHLFDKARKICSVPHFSLTTGIIEGVDCVVDDKLRPLVRRSAVSEFDTIDQVIQGRPEIMKSIAGDGEQFVRAILKDSQFNNIVSGVNVAVMHSGVWIIAHEDLLRMLEIKDVSFGPF